MIVTQIKIKNNTANIICSDNSVTSVSIETYLNNHILLNQEITKEQLQELVSKDQIDVIRIETIKKLTKKRMSIKECREYLSSCNLKDEIVDKIVKEFINNYLLDDTDLAENIIALNLVNKKGVNHIKDVLFSRGVSGDYNEYLNKFLDMEKYNLNIEYLVDKYNKLGKNKSGRVLYEYIKSHLLNNGYKLSEIEPFIKLDKKDDKAIIANQVSLFFKHRERNDKNIAKITKKLVSKGFNYDIIKSTIRECEKNEVD